MSTTHGNIGIVTSYRNMTSMQDSPGQPMNHTKSIVSMVYKGAFLGLLCFGIIEKSYACSCAPPPPPIDSLAGSDAVFVGTVLGHSWDGDEIKYDFRVEEVWKGVSYLQISVFTSPSVASCGYPFEFGKKYLVYAGRHEGLLATSICHRTQLLADAGFDIQQLGPPTATRADLSANPPSSWSIVSVRLVVLCVVLVVCLSLLVAWLIVRHVRARPVAQPDVPLDDEDVAG